MNKNALIYFLILFFLFSNIILIYYLNQSEKKINELNNELIALKSKRVVREDEELLESRTYSRKAIEFLHLFITKVLKAEKEIDFETKLELENRIRELQDREILDLWNKFINSKTEIEAQTNVKDLMEALTKKSLNE